MLRTSNLYVALCFQIVDGENSLDDILAARSPIELSNLVKRVEDVHGKFHHVTYKRDMPRYHGVAHLKLAGLFQ